MPTIKKKTQLVAASFTFIMICNVLRILKEELSIFPVDQTLPSFSKDKGEQLFGHRKICLSTISLFDSEDHFATTRVAYAKAEAFHNGGGNLKSLEIFLNSHIDDTYKRHGISFVPKGSEGPLPPNESISDTIKETLKKNDLNKRGGYDQRQLPGYFTIANEKIIHKGRLIEVLEPHNGERWDYGIGPINNVCKSVDRISSKKNKKSYDDKFMCSYNNLEKGNKSVLLQDSTDDENIIDSNKECAIVSIGSNGQWGFEENIAESTDCVTHTFDCTVSKDSRKPNIDSINFYPYCISSKDEVIEDRKYMTYSKMINQAGLTQPPALFKMDVEGFEFDVITQMLEEVWELKKKPLVFSDGSVESNGLVDLLPSQISVELHFATRMFDLPWMLRTKTTAEIAMFIGMMYTRGGYMLTKFEPTGPGCYSCAEMLFVRVLCDI